MPTSKCTSNKHQEYSCLIKWGVSSKKFKVDKWCNNCIDTYSHAHIVKEYVATIEPKKKTPTKGKNKK